MPGIVGLITKIPRKQAESRLCRMVHTMCHETFYRSDTWVDESFGIYVGWTALENSFSKGMPIQNERGDVVLIFSGEEFSEPGARHYAEKHAHMLDTKGPSNLVPLLEGAAENLAHLNGWFHGLLINRSQSSARLFNDRYGMHRLYYYESREAFYFAAESKALLAVCPELRSIDDRSMGEFVACGCVLENRTLFKGIRVLPSASDWTFRSGKLQTQELYFSPREWEVQEPFDSPTYQSQIQSVFSQNLDRYFSGEESIGMSLTGGLDTRMIMAWRHPAPQSLPCYSFGGMYRDCRDVAVAKQVAAACGQSHQIISVGDEFLSQFPHYAERSIYLTDGCIDVGHSPDLYVNERARKIAPVRMTGNYGGEVLRGVRAFRAMQTVPRLFAGDFLPFLDAARTTYQQLTDDIHPVSFAAFRQAPWHHHGLLSLEKTQVTLRSPFLDNALVKTAYRCPKSDWVYNQVCNQLIAAGDPVMARIPTDRGDVCAESTLYSRSRRRFIELTVKAEYAYDYGMPQWLAKADSFVAPLHFERIFLGRHKFYHFRVWYRDYLATYVREMLLDRTTLSRPYVQSKIVKSIVADHLTGKGNYTVAIHKLLTLELIHRLFIDSNHDDWDGDAVAPTETQSVVSVLK
jgi:asparagine synthase (glutamine-hydrolysing)